ncbi:MAG: hypothetical protein Q8S84_07695 [bacterium]|nr:hypothetical protein [bacterium]MDP3381326.1 hypothetical protein [bacterium]
MSVNSLYHNIFEIVSKSFKVNKGIITHTFDLINVFTSLYRTLPMFFSFNNVLNA